jgi:hypothetical protein
MARLNMAKAIYLYNITKGFALLESGDIEGSQGYFTRAQYALDILEGF